MSEVSLNEMHKLTGLMTRTIVDRLVGVPFKKHRNWKLYNSHVALPLAYGIEVRNGQARLLSSSSSEEEGKGLTAIQRLDLARAEHAELRLKKDLGSVLDVEVVAKTWTDLLLMVRQRLLSVPNKLESQFVDGMTARQVREMVEREVDEVLSDLSGEPDYRQQEELVPLEDVIDDDEPAEAGAPDTDDTTPEAESESVS